MNERLAATIVLSLNLLIGCGFIVFLRFLSPLAGLGASSWPWLVAGLFYLVLCLPVVRVAHARFRVALIALFFAPLVPFPITGQERFLKDLFSVKPGMSPERVHALMRDYIPGSGWPANPFSGESGEVQVPGCEIFRHSNQGNYDSDWGVVCFKDGKVASVEFWPD